MGCTGIAPVVATLAADRRDGDMSEGPGDYLLEPDFNPPDDLGEGLADPAPSADELLMPDFLKVGGDDVLSPDFE
jgi:hypothetical protein